MKLTVLGASGTYPAAGRPGSGYLVEWGAATVWVDAGPGTFGALCERVDPGELDALVISHRHPDHCTDIFALFHYLAFGPGGRVPLRAFVPAGTAEHLAGFVGGEPGNGTFQSHFDFRTVGDGDVAEVAGLELRFAEAEHSVPTVGVRLSAGGRALTYSGDTGPGGGVPELAQGADVLLCEATYQEPRERYPYPYHLTAREAGQLARTAGVDRLMLTHIPPKLDSAGSIAEAASEFDGPITSATPGEVVVV